MKKYEIIKNGLDDYTLKYKDQEIHFRSNVSIVSELQDVTRRARLKMVQDLAKDGMTIKDLVVETEKDGKTILDHSNKDFIEESYVKQEQASVFQNVIEKMLGCPLENLVLDMGLNEKEVEEFGAELGKCIVGTPRG